MVCILRNEVTPPQQWQLQRMMFTFLVIRGICWIRYVGICWPCPLTVPLQIQTANLLQLCLCTINTRTLARNEQRDISIEPPGTDSSKYPTLHSRWEPRYQWVFILFNANNMLEYLGGIFYRARWL